MKKLLLLTGILVSSYALPHTTRKSDFNKVSNLKEEIIISENFQKFLVEEWYWFTLCGNNLAFITESEEEALDQAFEYYMTHSSCARQRGEAVYYYV